MLNRAMATCPQCSEPLHGAGLSCAECGWSKRKGGGAASSSKAPIPMERRHQTHCPIHREALRGDGFCRAAQAWWVPRFACPDCAGPLFDNGYCANCTPKTQRFPGDHFEERWDSDAGREYGHFVRVSGPAPAPTEGQVQDYLAELKALITTVSDKLDAEGEGVSRRLRGCRCGRCLAHFARAREPGEEPAWILSDA